MHLLKINWTISSALFKCEWISNNSNQTANWTHSQTKAIVQIGICTPKRPTELRNATSVNSSHIKRHCCALLAHFSLWVILVINVVFNILNNKIKNKKSSWLQKHNSKRMTTALREHHIDAPIRFDAIVKFNNRDNFGDCPFTRARQQKLLLVKTVCWIWIPVTEWNPGIYFIFHHKAFNQFGIQLLATVIKEI